MACIALIAEPETHLRSLLDHRLASAGITPVATMDGNEAFELATRHLPDLILADYQLPGLSGLELCANLRWQPCTRHIPVFLLTSEGVELPQRSLRWPNLRDTIRKPIDWANLQRCIEAVVTADLTADSTPQDMDELAAAIA